jgi:hypothetical protein
VGDVLRGCACVGDHIPECPASRKGAKFDGGKAPWHLLPWGAVTSVVEVLGYGAKKYAPNNWQHVPEARDRYFSAAVRHLLAWRGGEDLDPESGLPHLAHAACCVLFLGWFGGRK